MYDSENDSELILLYDNVLEKMYSLNGDVQMSIGKDVSQNEISTICKINDKHYMIFVSSWNINNKDMYIVNAYDIEYIYAERDRQLRNVLYTDIIILAFSSVIISFFSIFLTNPINTLNKSSKKIANGKFDERVYINSKDEIGELAESFNIMADQIESKIDALKLQIKQKNDFINGFTHELKTPMTAIIGYSDLLRLRKCDEELSQKAINYIYTESKRLENLSFKLMKLMSLTEENIEMSEIDVFDFMNKIVKQESCNLKENIIELEIGNSKVIGDYDLLYVVIRNLIENSSKAEPKDNKIVIKGEKIQKNKYKISVIDKGNGIPKEHIERVTEDFYMVDKSRSRKNGGSGIGLSLTKKILELHSSKLYIESEENIGTTVYFELKEVEK